MAYGTSIERGYGQAHQAERRKWEPIVQSGEARCVFEDCQLPIDPKGEWDLDHNADRTGWRGPAHVKCNRAAGARNATKARLRNQATTTRDW